MDTATSGAVFVDGKDISKWNKKQLTGYRRDDIGFVFQFYNLVPNLTAKENVELSTSDQQRSTGCRRSTERCRTWTQIE